MNYFQSVEGKEKEKKKRKKKAEMYELDIMTAGHSASELFTISHMHFHSYFDHLDHVPDPNSSFLLQHNLLDNASIHNTMQCILLYLSARDLTCPLASI